MINKPHIPKIDYDKDAEGFIVKCAKCGKILWYQDDDDCHPVPPTLQINVSEDMGTADKFGG